MKATFTSVWDGDVTLSSSAEYDPTTGAVEVLETYDADGLDSLEEEYIETDGVRLEICRHCHEGVVQTTMDPNPNDPDDKTLYENKTCRVCGERN